MINFATTILNFLVLGFIFTSICSITATNPVISVIFLITTFVQVAMYLILIGINFIGISYIVIYVGAIAVLFLFVIMMINIKLTDVLETGSNYTKNLPLAINIVIFFIFILFTILPLSFNNFTIKYNINNIEYYFGLSNLNNNINISFPSRPASQLVAASQQLREGFDFFLTFFSEIEVLGHNLYTYGSILLIVLSIILLLAMLATIVLSKQNKNI
uniref:NADH-ubiquinone oxidoreductase chain 6 n=1 Tax=Gymnopilus junonius TaxID=109634 RepID=A0A890JKD6_GYMJU|nr:NADH dehydrogenase subunit 6 [Gymnopilus junonius]QRH17743.1 NADH dehydrogenase subunit 6 [Gymnopilus junonius]